jgi:phosphate transport system substrate-binding protein
MKKLFTAALAAAIALTGGLAMAQEEIVIDGSTTVGPIAKAFAEYFTDKYGVNVTVNESGSGNGAKSLINNACDIASMSRFMKDGEFEAAVDNGVFPVAHVVALDGIAIAVHPSNPVSELTVQQVKDIYLGDIKNWEDVGGPDAPIVPITRDTNSGTFEVFEKLVMDKEEIVQGAEVVSSNGQMRNRVGATRYAIGYLGLGFVDDSVKPVTIEGVEATPETIKSGDYPIARPLFMVTDGVPKLGTPLNRFVNLYMTRDGEAMVNGLGFIARTSYED